MMTDTPNLPCIAGRHKITSRISLSGKQQKNQGGIKGLNLSGFQISTINTLYIIHDIAIFTIYK
jgi:hypothetical protein